MNKPPRFRHIVWVALPALLALQLVTGCARVPPEAVALSESIGRDLELLHRANRNLVLQYFGGMKEDIDRFVDEVYRPFIIKKTLKDLDLIASIQAAQDPSSVLDPVDLMQIYSEEVIDQVESFRAEMMRPIEEQEAEVLERVDTGFIAIRQANSAVTGHLASVRKVYEAQEHLLERFGIEKDLRESIADTAANASRRLGAFLQKARSLEERTDEIFKKIPSNLKNVLAGEDAAPLNDAQEESASEEPAEDGGTASEEVNDA